MSTQTKRYITPEEYLAIERGSEHRHEYFRGELFAMAGASRAHSLIGVNLTAELRGALKGGPCEAHASDMRVRVLATGLYTYPDASVVCQDAQFDDKHVDTLVNPVVIFEVLSPSTEAYDRGKKFEHYRTLESLREYVLVAQDAPRVEHFARLDDGSWRMTVVNGLEAALELPALACRLPLSEIYARVDFSTAESSKPPIGKEQFD
jgi:Uma2 family endonuclease